MGRINSKQVQRALPQEPLRKMKGPMPQPQISEAFLLHLKHTHTQRKKRGGGKKAVPSASSKRRALLRAQAFCPQSLDCTMLRMQAAPAPACLGSSSSSQGRAHWRMVQVSPNVIISAQISKANKQTFLPGRCAAPGQELTGEKRGKKNPNPSHKQQNIHVGMVKHLCPHARNRARKERQCFV